MFQLYLQQKWNVNRNNVIFNFNIAYFINDKEAAQLNIDYFESLFEEVHLTNQMDGDYFWELFDLKPSIVQEFDFWHEKGFLNQSYSAIIEFFKQQEVLIDKSLYTNHYEQIRRIKFVEGVPQTPDLYITQLLTKYNFLKGRHGIPSTLIPTPHFKWTATVEDKIASYFGCYFQDINCIQRISMKPIILQRLSYAN